MDAALPDSVRARRLLREMVRIRRFEEKCVELYSAQKIRGFMHLYIGEEAVAVGVMERLTPGDAVVATYREHGQALARGIAPGAIMAEMYGKVEGCARGRGGSMHVFDRATRFYGGQAIVGGGLPLAVGLALAERQLGRPGIAVCFFGEGAVAEGEFHESMNLAALWRLPVLFVCENNLYAMGTALAISESQTDIARKAAAYDVASAAVDGMDVLAVSEAARAAVAIVGEGRPYLLECRTYRFRPHSMFDAELYRSRDEVAAWKQRDPIPAFFARMRDAAVLTESDYEAVEREVARDIDDAVAFAEAGTWEPVADLTRFVYSEGARR
jgi:pyruvate dehydrogenase E1 component alpha subunit/2-oxoisovalerate dehydrogenase E1 component